MNAIIYGASRAMAWFGALVLVAIATLSVASIVGRAFSFAGLGPIRGDFELVEAGTALAVFCFLPWCPLRRGHATVDMLWPLFPARLRRGLDIAADALMLGAWLLLTWRMGIATADFRANGEVSFILQMPAWWGYAASMVPAAFGCVAYAWRLLETLGLATPPAGLTPIGSAH